MIHLVELDRSAAYFKSTQAGSIRNFTNSLLDRLTDEFRGTVNLTLLLARPGVSVRSGPRIFNRVDPSRIS
jgi:hypothetical protein